MEIITYRELEKKEDIFLLLLKSFWLPASACWFQEYMKYETRIGDGPVGMCGIDSGRLVGFVGMMNIPTRTKQGEIENVGGIYMVAVRPSCMHQGIGKKLLNAAEEYMRKQGTRLSFLTTSRSIVAYNWYRKIGYEDVIEVDQLPHMYKYFRPSHKADKRQTTSKGYRIDIKKVQKLFDHHIRNRCGFVIRTTMDLKAREMVSIYNKKMSIAVDGGYALLRSSFDTVQFMEILARTQNAYKKLIKLAEAKARYASVAIYPFDPVALANFEKAGYRTDLGSYGVLMCKPLEGTSFYDLYDESFLLSRIDWF
jgi:ribosomal protein S18 acetylase RimI-like enzyme